MIQGKVWGQTQKIIGMEGFEVHRLWIRAGGFCSIHRHVSKHNQFYLESGELTVRVYPHGFSEPTPSDQTILHPGDTSSVSPGALHQFEACKDSIAFEIYWPAAIAEDIERFTEGGSR